MCHSVPWEVESTGLGYGTGEEGEESRLPPELFPRTAVLMGKAMVGPLWEGRRHDLLFVQKLEMPL